MSFARVLSSFVLLTAMTASAQVPEGWSTIEAETCHVHFPKPVTKDALNVRDILSSASEAPIAGFARFDVGALLRDTDCSVFVHQTPTDDATIAKATTRSGVTEGRYRAEIHLLALSSHPPEPRTSAGEPKDLEYMRKLVNHEYSSIVLDRITRTKRGGGWRFYSAPAWFVQGYEEYLGLLNSSIHNRTVLFAKYKEIVRSDPRRVSLAPAASLRNSYIDGAVLLAFLHNHFWQRPGAERTHIRGCVQGRVGLDEAAGPDSSQPGKFALGKIDSH
jgi:hypothetical protein